MMRLCSWERNGPFLLFMLIMIADPDRVQATDGKRKCCIIKIPFGKSFLCPWYLLFNINFKYLHPDEKSYTLIGARVKCTGTDTLYWGNCDGNLCREVECRGFCDKNDLCKFFAIWKSGHCETYSECPFETPKNFEIRLWKQNDVLG